MKLLLDNCVHRRARELFPDHQVTHVNEVQMERLQNGELHRMGARNGFEVLVTTDQNIRHQQNLEKLPMAVLELDSRDQRLAALLLFTSWLPQAIEHIGSYRFVSVTPDGVFVLLAKRDVEREDGPGPSD